MYKQIVICCYQTYTNNTLVLSFIMPNILSLPQELHTRIFNHIPPTLMSRIINLRYTCKTLFASGQQARFDTIEILTNEKNETQKLLELLTDNPHIGCHIRRLLIAGLQHNDTFLPILRYATGLKVLTLHHCGNANHAFIVPTNIVQHIASQAITALSIFNYSISIQLVNNILCHLPALLYLSLSFTEYETDVVTTHPTSSHSSLQILHVICTSAHIDEIISDMIATTIVNWSAIEQLIITQPVEGYMTEHSFHTYHPKLISMLSDNLVFLHLSITKKMSNEKTITYGLFTAIIQ